MKIQAFHIDEFLEKLLVEFKVVPAPVEDCFTHRRLPQVGKCLKVGMIDGIRHRNSLFRRKLQHFEK